MIKRLILILICISSSLFSSDIREEMEKMRIVSEILNPMSFENERGEPDGLGIAVAREIMKRLDLDLTIGIYPWKRAYAYGLKGPGTIVVTMNRIESREELFHWVGPLVSFSAGFYGRKGENLPVSSLEDAAKLKMVGISGIGYERKVLSDRGFTNLSPGKDTTAAVNMLMEKRIDLISATDVTLSYFLTLSPWSLSDLKHYFNYTCSDAYLAFSSDVSPEIVNLWQNTFDEIKEEGILDRLLAQWVPVYYKNLASSRKILSGPPPGP